MTKTEVIAEAGINHMGSLTAAMSLAEEAKKAGADVVKFQTYQVGKLLHRSDPDWDKLASCQLPRESWVKLALHCANLGIEFMSTPGDVDSLKFLVEELGVRRIKIGSDDMTYWPLIDEARKTGLPLIISTGMADREEVRSLLDKLDWVSANNITLLHCTSLYPCPMEKVNLRAMEDLRQIWGHGARVGYSDHTQGTTAVLAAVALGAQVVEKHIMLHKSYLPIDVDVSIFPHLFSLMVQNIREVEAALGSTVKAPWTEEVALSKRVRKDLHTGLRPLP